MAETTYYVDTDVVGGGSDGSSWANAYSSLNQAEQARDADITGGNAVVFRCRASGGTADATAVSVNGWLTDADSYIKIVCETGDTGGRHDGKWNTGKYRLAVANAIVLSIQEEYVRIDGLQIAKTGSDANLEAPLLVASQLAGNEIWISNCVIWGDSNASYTQPVCHVNDADVVVKMWNCCAYSSGGTDGTNSSALLLANCNNASSFYSCTFIGRSYGVRCANTITAIAKNCYFHGETGDRSYGTSAGLTTTTCASSSTNFEVDSIAHSTATFVNVTAGSEDYHLVVGSALIGAGTDTSGESEPLNFTTDIVGTTRS